MSRYEGYNNIEDFWIREVPSHWDSFKAGNMFDERREKVSDKEFEPLSVTKKGILKQLGNVAKTNDGDNRKKVLVNDFVINSRSDRKGSSGLSFFNGSVSLINIVLTLKIGNPKYMHYLLRSTPFQEEFYRNGKGIVSDLWSTNYQLMKNIMIPFPPIQEQKQIADYLDWKINEIDKLISIEKEKIKETQLLKGKYIDGVISGIKSNFISLKEVFEFGKGLSITKNNLGEKGVRCINYGEIHREFKFSFVSNDERLKGLEYDEGVSISNFCSLELGDFIFADTSEDLDGCGNFTFLEKQCNDIYAGYHTIVAKRKINFNYRYMAYFFESELWRRQIKEKVKGVKVYSITQSVLKSTKVQIPKYDVQIEIVKVLDSFMRKYKSLLEVCKNTVFELEALKQSLISEVVTGQIDVRNVVIPDYEKVDSGVDEEIEEGELLEYGD